MVSFTADPERRLWFTTARLNVGPWQDHAVDLGLDLPTAVREVLTADTTADLPPSWQGAYSLPRAEAWIRERDAESPTLLVTSIDEPSVIGLVIVDETHVDDTMIDLRIGYVIATRHSGKGLASELLAGLVDWARGEPTIRMLTGGVSTTNSASIRVLEKCGFAAVEPSQSSDTATYRLHLR